MPERVSAIMDRTRGLRTQLLATVSQASEAEMRRRPDGRWSGHGGRPGVLAQVRAGLEEQFRRLAPEQVGDVRVKFVLKGHRDHDDHHMHKILGRVHPAGRLCFGSTLRWLMEITRML